MRLLSNQNLLVISKNLFQINNKMRRIFILSGLIISFFNNSFMKASDKEHIISDINQRERENKQCELYQKTGLIDIQKYALNKNRNFQNTKLNIKSAEHLKRYHKRSLFPIISITGNIDNAIDEWTDYKATRKSDQSTQNSYVQSTTDTNTLSAEITWNILNPSIYSSIKNANHNLNESKYLSMSAYNNLLKEVRLSAINVDQQLDKIKSTEDSIIRAQKLLEISNAQLESGFITKQDFARQKNQSFQYENELRENLLNFNTSLTNLNLLIKNDNCPLMASDSIKYIANKKNKIGENKNQLISQAFENRFDIKSLREKIKANKANIQYYKRVNLPSTSLYISSTIYDTYYDEKLSSASKETTDTFYNDLSVGITTTSTFSSGQNNSMIKSLQSQAKILENQYLDLQDSIRSEISNLFFERDTFLKQEDILKKQYIAAEETFKAIESAFSKGYSTMTEVLDAQRNLSSVEKALIMNESNKSKNLVNLLRQISISEL